MSYADSQFPAASWAMTADQASADERAGFIKKTYLHLLGAVLAFCALEYAYLSSNIADDVMQRMMGGGNAGLLIAFVLFMGASWLARYWASTSTSVPLQYAGLALYVVAQSVIFIPILYYAVKFGGPNLLPTAGLATMFIFAALTAAVFMTGKDFSFLGTALFAAGAAIVILFVCSLVFGFSLGILFTVAMIALACGYILYDTSNVLHQYQIGQHVAASLALFSSVALLFMYILRLFMQARD